MSEFFPDVPRIAFGGPGSRNPLEFKHYDPDEVVGGKTLRDHLRFSVVYWHTFSNPLSDPFGSGTALRPWDDGSHSVANAQQKARAAFEFIDSNTGEPHCGSPHMGRGSRGLFGAKGVPTLCLSLIHICRCRR